MLKKSDIAHRPWNVLRLALLWARKGGVFRRRPMMDLRHFPKFLKSLRCSTEHGAIIHYREREFSFDNTPIIHVKMHRTSSMRFRMPRIPCINPPVDFHYDFPDDDDDEDDDDDDDVLSYCNDEARKSFLMIGDEDYNNGYEVYEENIISLGSEGIDVKAEQFITKFYEQMKLERQISFTDFNDMLNRGTN